MQQRSLRKEKREPFIKLPEGKKEYFVLYTTEYHDTYLADVITSEEIKVASEILKKEDERNFENKLNYDLKDLKSDIILNERITKIRKLNKSIGDNLKLFYDYKCQICGDRIGDKYSANVIEAHHIDYFVKSFNNDSRNLIILCPNHHRIIHNVNPFYDRKRKLFIYKNGLIEGLK